MAANVTTIRPGRLTLSRIVYHTNLQRSTGLVIPLGVIAEIKVPSVRVLGLIARTRLHRRELNKIGGLLRDKLAEPFDFLELELDWALENTKAGEALSELARRHPDSLLFSPPTVKNVSKKTAFATGQDLAIAARNELRRLRDKEFSTMISGTPVGTGIVPNRSTSELGRFRGQPTPSFQELSM